MEKLDRSSEVMAMAIGESQCEASIRYDITRIREDRPVQGDARTTAAILCPREWIPTHYRAIHYSRHGVPPCNCGRRFCPECNPR